MQFMLAAATCAWGFGHRASAAVLISALVLFACKTTWAQQGPAGNVPPSLAPQASEQVQQKVAEHTAPTVSLAAPADNALFTAPATVLLEATANSSSSGRSITQVEFFAGATLIGTATTAPYRFNWTSVAAGSYSLTAKATDNLGVASTSAPVPIIVNAPPAIGLTSPANGTVFTAPAAITLTAMAADTDGSITQVEFFQGAALLATVTSTPYSHTLTNVPAGSFSFSARATDNWGAVTTSAAVAVTVNAPPTIFLTSPANNATFTAPADIPVTADVADTDGTIASVAFYEGANLIAMRTTSPYSIVWTGVPTGSYSLAARVTDNLGATATSAVVNVTVSAAVGQIFYIHTDHLNTPRRIHNQSQQLVWSWDHAEPFGANPPNENPLELGNFTCNLRLPGQYFDRETGLHHNYFRDYDPGVGRYVESDLIGLRGGINTYTYVRNDPMIGIDPKGLVKIYGNWCGPNWTGGTDKPYDQIPVRNLPNLKPPVDILDACCAGHDVCHADCRFEFPCTPNKRGLCFEICDRDLWVCARNSGVTGPRAWGVQQYMRRSNPDPDANDPRCAGACMRDSRR